MKDEKKTKKQLIEELAKMRQRDAKLSAAKTEPEQAEKLLRESEERFRSQYQNIPIPTYTWQRAGEDFILIDYNKAGETMTSGTISNLKGVKVSELYNDQPEIVADFSQCFDKRTVIKKKMPCRLKTTDENKHLAVTYAFVPPDLILVHTEDITERKQAEENLRESKELFEKTFVSQLDALLLLDTDNPPKILDCNPSTTRVFGYSRKEMLGRTTDFLHVDEKRRQKFQKHLYPSIDEQGFFHLAEFEMKRSDGTVFPTEHTAMPLEDEQGKRIGWVSVVRDISERKRAEDVQKESEQRFRAVLEAVPDLMLVLDAEGRYREVFTANTELLYAPVDQVLGKKIHDVLPPENAKQIQKVIDRVLATGELQLYEYKLQTGGIDRWFAGRATKFSFQNTDCVLWCARDITQCNLAEEALRESEERHRILLEASPDPIAVYDMEGKATYINPAFEEAFGWPSQELLGKRIEYVPEENWPETRTAIARMLRGEKIQSFETRRLTKDGRILDIQLSSSVFHHRDDNPAGNVVILRDVTERKRAEDSLRKSEAELAEQSRHLEEVNAALKALLRQRENDKADLEQRLISNVKELVMPYVEKLKNSRSHSDRMTLVGILESNMKEIVSPFVTKLSSRFLNLTPTEIQVASLIKDGKTSKEIAVLLNASENTVRSHRFHIRSKLGIKNRKVNFRSYLQSIQE